MAFGLCTAPAQAQPGNVVVFGDSFAANPDQHRNRIRKIPGTESMKYLTDYPTTGNCLQGPDNFPRLLAYQTGLTVKDWSCSGAASWHVVQRINYAINAGDLHPGTRAVVLSVGFNDYWPNNSAGANTGLDQARIQDNFVRNMHIAAGKIRAAAPNAKLIFPGMLSISEPYGMHSVCAVNMIPNAPLGIPVPLLQNVESRNRDNQIRAAREIGAHYIDIKTMSAAHNTCARDKDRWVSGYIDFTTPDYQMPFHPSRAGSAFVAREIARVL